MPKIDVYGLSKEHIQKLEAAALNEFGERNISLMARKILLDKINTPSEMAIKPDTTSVKHRLEIRIAKKELHTLTQIAANENVSTNRYVALLIKQHLYKHAPLTDGVANALIQSNYQLLRIGRNLNQIARQLNIGEEANLTSQKIDALSMLIDQHTDVVGNVLQVNRRRFE